MGWGGGWLFALCSVVYPPPDRLRYCFGGRPPPQGGREEAAPYDSVRDVWLRTGLSPRVLERLADADAFASLGLTRREALWAAKALGRIGDSEDDLPLFASRVPGAAQHACDALQTRDLYDDQHMEWSRIAGAPLTRCTASGTREPEILLPPMPLGEEVVNDYRFLRLSLRAHPAQFLRADLGQRGILRNEALRGIANNTRVRISGLVTCRQRPGSAKGVVFMTIEDESAVANVIVWPKVFERVRPIVLGARYIAVAGRVQSESGVIHVVADQIEDLTVWLARLAEQGADIDSLARADEVRRPAEDQREARSVGGRNRLKRLMREMPELIGDLDVTAPGSAHAPTRRAG
ncbi:MAG: OB-fold nucleic acid binding domain-containing protein [Xanthobacteraceae bacterium]